MRSTENSRNREKVEGRNRRKWMNKEGRIKNYEPRQRKRL
jgi:hypothetical protein